MKSAVNIEDHWLIGFEIENGYCMHCWSEYKQPLVLESISSDPICFKCLSEKHGGGYNALHIYLGENKPKPGDKITYYTSQEGNIMERLTTTVAEEEATVSNPTCEPQPKNSNWVSICALVISCVYLFMIYPFL